MQNRDEVGALIEEVREKYPNKTIWVYTGYTWDAVKDLPYLKFVDVLVDGRFEIAKRSLECIWRGSTNQRLIDVSASLAKGETVLWEDWQGKGKGMK